MSVLGDALLEVTDAYRINYGILCNTEPALHAHVCPRYLTEPDGLRQGPPWGYHARRLNQVPFDYERDRELMGQLAAAIRQRLG